MSDQFNFKCAGCGVSVDMVHLRTQLAESKRAYARLSKSEDSWEQIASDAKKRALVATEALEGVKDYLESWGSEAIAAHEPERQAYASICEALAKLNAPAKQSPDTGVPRRGKPLPDDSFDTKPLPTLKAVKLYAEAFIEARSLMDKDTYELFVQRMDFARQVLEESEKVPADACEHGGYLGTCMTCADERREGCKHLSQIDTLPPFCAVCGIELSGTENANANK